MDIEDRGYIKYVYWIEERAEPHLREILRDRVNIRLKYPKGVMCLALDKRYKVGCVTPEVWSQKCKRQGTWYYNSSNKGKLLIISSFKILGFDDMLECIIRESPFTPPRYATYEEKIRLAGNPSYKRLTPINWNDVSDVEKKWFIRFARRLGSTVEDFEYLFLTHNANHSNFIEPQLVISEGGLQIPYSIDISAHLCSCCLELFQIIGGFHRKKYVLPCPGAVHFGGLSPRHYLEVESVR